MEKEGREWGLTLIQRAIMDGSKAGATIAAVDEAVRSVASEARELNEAFPGESGRAAERSVQQLHTRLCTITPAAHQAELSQVLRAGVEAALVLGARAIAEAAATADDPSRLAELSRDELWLHPRISPLLLDVVHAIVAERCPLPGARRFLDHTRPAAPPEIHEMRGGPGSPIELRTDWIRDPDTATEYQWCVGRDRDRLSITHRRRGRRQFDAGAEIPISDVDTVVRLLETASTGPARASKV